jgi:hypothetical protein
MLSDRLHDDVLSELLRNKGRTLYHREGQELEFKEQFNLSGLADYFRDFAAFANNKGGYLIFGVKDNPREANGMSEKSIEHFEKIDPEKITGYLLEIFSADIKWSQVTYDHRGKAIGVFYIYEAHTKPVIAKKDEGKDNIICNGEIYYRYGGRTQKILYAELENIINKRIETNNKLWIDLVEKIGKSGPNNAAILDLNKGVISKENNQIFMVDEELIKQMNVIREGEFNEKDGAKTLKLIGEITPTNTVEVIRKVKENLIKDYPFSAREFANEVKLRAPGFKETLIWQVLNENKIRGNPDYSAYNFRSKKQEDQFKETQKVPQGVPCIYNAKSIDFVANLIKNYK